MGLKKDDRVNIKISKQTQAELKSFGLFGDTYEDIIKKLIEGYANDYNEASQ